MAVKRSSSSIKGIGARYGRKVRHKISKIKSLRKRKHSCPYCHSKSTARIAAGIWKCSKCSSKFTSKAYYVAEKVKIKEEVHGEIEAPEIEEPKKKEKKEKKPKIGEEAEEDKDFEEENKQKMRESSKPKENKEG